jgi:hypothetical protein
LDEHAVIADGKRSAAERRSRLLLYAAWLVLAVWFASRHIFWRDEVRAFTLALSGDNVVDMLRGVQGEGHPALWYLLLRGAHALVPVREVLPAVAVVAAAAAMAILAFRSPFRLSTLFLLMFGAAGLFEYAVNARNYGISLVFLFLVAHLYPRMRDRGIGIGLLLALLCNTNVPAVFLAASIMLFWLAELVSEDGLRWTPRLAHYAINGGIAAAGALLAFFTVYPPANDAAVNQVPPNAADLLPLLLDPAYAFPTLAPPLVGAGAWVAPLLSLLILGSVIGLVRAPGALLSSLAAILAFELFYLFVYSGQYRHQALLLYYLATMYWLVANGRGGAWPARWRMTERLGRIARFGWLGFLALLALQLPASIQLAIADSQGYKFGRARDLADLLVREHLQRAILIAQPDVLLEPLPYYAENPLYFTREGRFGRVAAFSKKARVDLDLGQVLDRAAALQARSGRPVVLIMQQAPDPAAPLNRIDLGYLGTFSATSEQARRFLASTRRLAVLGPAISDESYSVYLLNSGAKPSA